MKILIATDGSAHSKAAVKEFAKRSFDSKTSVRIISVIDKVELSRNIGTMMVSNDYSTLIETNALKAANDAIEYAAKILREKNPSLTITTSVIDGSPKNAILEEADTFGADLIIVGSHGYGAIERFMLGSVSHAVSLHAKCSVEIVRIKNSKKNNQSKIS